LRTLSSNPGNEARCFLNGDAMEPSVLSSADGFADDEDEACVADEASGAGVPDRGDAEES
jgi:hypothetical protein